MDKDMWKRLLLEVMKATAVRIAVSVICGWFGF